MDREHLGMDTPGGGGIADINQLLPGFAPVTNLWQSAAPAFATEHAARWYLRQYRQPLIAAQALAFFGGRYYFHRERFSSVLRELAMEQARSRSERSLAAD